MTAFLSYIVPKAKEKVKSSEKHFRKYFRFEKFLTKEKCAEWLLHAFALFKD
jgi:hypothetical protein